MEKSWVWLPRTSLEYQTGARNFVNAATTSLGNPSAMLCPCIDCRNLCHQTTDTMFDHLVIRGMDEKYKRNSCWRYHGDRKTANEDFQVVSKKFRELRKGQIPHTTSRKGMNRLAHDMKKKSSDPSKVSRSKVWVAGHTHSDGRHVRPEFADTVEQIKSLDSELASTTNTSIREDAVSQVLGRDKPGRLRGMGRGVTATYLAFLQARDARVHKLKKSQEELFNKLETLQNQVRFLAKGNKLDDVSTLELDSKCSQNVLRCQLLDWYSKEDVVVGEGEYCSSEPMYKVGRIPLGPNASAVIVRSVLEEDACLWRPTPTVVSLCQAVGIKIAWPSNKINLVDGLDSQTENQTSESSVSHDKIIIYDWTMEDVIVAEGRMCSTDPKEVINNIPIGPNVAVLKVEKVVKKDAYLWRPTSEIYLMEHVLQDYIVWPMNKIFTPPSRQASPKASSPKSISCSFNNSSSIGKKKTCMLLDCENSGEIVAENTLQPIRKAKSTLSP